MSKSVSFKEDIEQATAGPADDGRKKHTLESDEEDAVDDDVLDDDDIEGQEDETIAFDGSTPVMPFNMKEEMETGHFDKTGTYIFDKEDDLKDNWMDNIDWVKVKHDKEKVEKEGSSSDSEPEAIDEISVYKEMLIVMKPGETVAKAMRRLGGGVKKMTSAQRWKAKKQKIAPSDEEVKSKEAIQHLTSLADKIIQNGNMEIYEDTYEKLAFNVKQAEDAIEAAKVHIPEGTDPDDALDMFADAADEKTTPKEPSNTTLAQEKTIPADPNNVQWEYKWENTDGAEVFGPYSSADMHAWNEAEHFKDGVFVRKVGAGGEFYTSRRIDFELYT